MSVQIPLNGSAPAAETTGGVAIPLGTGLSLPFFGTDRVEKVVRAVAAAAALEDPAAALSLARLAIDDPAAVAEREIDRLALDPVLVSVSAALTQRGTLPVTAEQRAAAVAVGVDAELVAVAQAALNSKATPEALTWVATAEPALLDPAASAVVRQKSRDFVPRPTSASVPASRLDDIERRIKALEDAKRKAATPTPQK